MTRNTKLYQVTYNNVKIIFRDLTVKEVDFIDGITNEVLKGELAGKLAIIEPTDTKDVPIGVLLQVGSKAFKNSIKNKRDKDLYEIAVKDFRKKLEDESKSPLPLIVEILKVLPGQSVTDLLDLTYNDLIELACMCEKIKGSQILNTSQGIPKKKGIKLIDPRNLPDDGKSLKDKMAELNNVLGTRR